MIVTYIPALTVVPPPKPRGTVDGLVRVVKSSYEAVGNVKEITLPDGKRMQQTECNAIQDPFARDNCLLLFSEVTDCRKLPAAEATECEETKIKEYVGEEDTGDFGDFEDETEDGDAEAPP
jgi:hypothetical protein